MKALIHNNRVVQLEETPFEVHPSLIWVDAPVECKPEWSYVNGVFSAPPEPIPTPVVTPTKEQLLAQLQVLQQQIQALE